MVRYSITVFTEVKKVKPKATNTHRYYGTGFHESKEYVSSLARTIISNLPSDEEVIKTELTREYRKVEPVRLAKRVRV